MHASPPAPTFTLWTGLPAGEVITKALAQGMPDLCARLLRRRRVLDDGPGPGPAHRASLAGGDQRGGRLRRPRGRRRRVGIMHLSEPGCRNNPVEVLEVKSPMLIEHYGLRPDSGGPGEHRGGLGVSRGSTASRRRPRPSRWSRRPVPGRGAWRAARRRQLPRDPAAGHRPGRSSAVSTNRWTRRGAGQQLRRWRRLGDPPSTRSTAVLQDVREGYVTLAAARQDYGVVIDDATWSSMRRPRRLRERAEPPPSLTSSAPRHEALPLRRSVSPTSPDRPRAAHATRGGTDASIPTRHGPWPCGTGAMAPPPRSAPWPRTRPIEVAYLSASSANTWLAASREAMERSPRPTTSHHRVRRSIQRGTCRPRSCRTHRRWPLRRHDRAALDGAGLIPDLEARRTPASRSSASTRSSVTTSPRPIRRRPALSASVMEPPSSAASASGASRSWPARAWSSAMSSTSTASAAIPLDVALKQGFDAVTAGSNVNVVAEGEGSYLGPDVGLAQMQDILVSDAGLRRRGRCRPVDAGRRARAWRRRHPGVRQADRSWAALDLGGPRAVKDGSWFGEVVGAPRPRAASPWRRSSRPSTATTSAASTRAPAAPDEGLMTAENVDMFTAEWDG